MKSPDNQGYSLNATRKHATLLERFRNKDWERQDLLKDLEDLGLDVQLAERGRSEEKTGPDSLGLIVIRQSPIRWVNLRDPVVGKSRHYISEYGIPDPRLFPNLRIKSRIQRAYPMFGRVTSVRWTIQEKRNISSTLEGIIGAMWKNDKGLESMLNCFRADSALGDFVMLTRYRFLVVYDRSVACWLIQHLTNEAPSMQVYYYYERIALHLLKDVSFP